MSILLEIYLVGMPVSLFVLLWAVEGAPREDLIEVGTVAGLAALAAWVLLWPLFLVICLYDAITER